MGSTSPFMRFPSAQWAKATAAPSRDWCWSRGGFCALRERQAVCTVGWSAKGDPGYGVPSRLQPNPL